MRAFLYLFLIIPMISYSQVNVYFSADLGSYSMNDMKDLQENIINSYKNININISPVYSFPVSLQGGMNLEVDDEEYAYGGFINFAKATSRIFYGDYSGKLSFDQNLNRILVGAIGRMMMDDYWSFYGKIGLNYSQLKLLSQTEIYNSLVGNENAEFTSIGLNIEPGLSFTYSIGKIKLQAHAGFELNIQGQTTFNNDKNAYLMIDDRKALIDWSGFRTGLGVGFEIN